MLLNLNRGIFIRKLQRILFKKIPSKIYVTSEGGPNNLLRSRPTLCYKCCYTIRFCSVNICLLKSVQPADPTRNVLPIVIYSPLPFLPRAHDIRSSAFSLATKSNPIFRFEVSPRCIQASRGRSNTKRYVEMSVNLFHVQEFTQ
jgi:hypothetical protein